MKPWVKWIFWAAIILGVILIWREFDARADQVDDVSELIERVVVIEKRL